MLAESFVEYKRREFCKDVKCPVQVELNTHADSTPAYEQARRKCSSGCLYTTWQFHHWLIEKGYLLLISSQLKGNEQTVLVNLDKQIVKMIDHKVKSGKFRDRSEFFAKVISTCGLELDK